MVTGVKTGDYVYIVENGYSVRPCKVLKAEGDMAVVELDSGALSMLRYRRLYATREDAEKNTHRCPMAKSMVSDPMLSLERYPWI